MLKKIFLIFIFFLCFYPSDALAQVEIPEDIVLGGIAKCKIIGNSPIHSGTTDGNRILLLNIEGTTQGSIAIQRIEETEKFLIDASANANFGQVNPEEFLSGKKISFESENSELKLKKIIKPSNLIVEVSNELSDATKEKLKGVIQLSNSEGDLAAGKMKLVFENTRKTITKGDKVNEKDRNGKVVVLCKFKDVPISRKESEF